MATKPKASTPPGAKKDLAIKESILGVLNAKDKTGTGSIPIADFDRVIAAFGVSWDSPAVQNVLDHCKVGPNENMNFSSLKEEVKLEKQRLLAKPGARIARSTTTVPAVPQASGILKEQAIMKEKQKQAVLTQKNQINTIYNMLSKHDIDKTTAIKLLSQHQIYPTKELLRIAGEMEVNDVPFADFNRALTASEPYPRTSAILAAERNTVFAGAVRPSAVDRFTQEDAIPGRKLFVVPKSQHFVPPDEPYDLEAFKPSRKMNDEARGKATCMGALFNETGDSTLGHPQEVDWTSAPAGRRHLVVDEEIGVDYARAQLNHGNCVTWQCEVSELEERNAALEKPVGRKLDDQQLLSNHFSDVVNWGNFRDTADAEDAARQEFAMIGGLRVASGERNRTSAKNILAWDSAPQRRSAGKKSVLSGPPPASAAVTNIGEIDRGAAPSPNLVQSLSQDGIQQAGTPSLRPDRPNLRTFGGSFSGTSGSGSASPVVIPPFGVDEPSSGSSTPIGYYNRGRTRSGARFGPGIGNSNSTSRSSSASNSPTPSLSPKGSFGGVPSGVSARNW